MYSVHSAPAAPAQHSPVIPRPALPNAEKPRAAPPATGPRTSQGKAVSARNATTHGLFARDIVLPALGEDPEGYRQLADEFTAQIAPRNLLERHYVEKIAAASWRLRRLHRWQAQLFEDETLTEDERLDRLDKVLRHETALHRQIDTAVKMLHKEVPNLYKSRARDQALLDTMQTERECEESLDSYLEVTFEAREQMKQTTADPELDYDRLDAAPSPASPHPSPFLNGESGAVAPGSPLALRVASAAAGVGTPLPGAADPEKCQNEPPSARFGIWVTSSAPEGLCAFE